jgi:SOS-response transcriptional repressor LexA
MRESTEKISSGISPEDRLEIRRRIRDLRKAVLRLHQRQFGLEFGVSQAAIARWESGEDMPPPRALITMGDLAGEPDKWWFYEKAGIKRQDASLFMSHSRGEEKIVPLLRDAIAAGMGRAIDEAIEDNWPLPKKWFPPGSSIVALKVVGDSMSPLVQEGYIVLIDTSERNPRKLAGQMIAAREGDGVTLKWLRKEGKFYQLVPQHTSRSHPVRIIAPGEEEEYGVVGRVIKWIGEPPK